MPATQYKLPGDRIILCAVGCYHVGVHVSSLRRNFDLYVGAAA